MKNHDTKNYDIAYGSFLFCGVVTLLISITSYIPMDSGIAGGFGFLIAIPLSMASLVALAVGIIQTVKLYKHWPLIVLSVLSVALLAEMLTEYGSTMFYNLVPVIYGVITCIFSLIWFAVLRKRDKHA